MRSRCRKRGLSRIGSLPDVPLLPHVISEPLSRDVPFRRIKQIRKSSWLPRDHAKFECGDSRCRLCGIGCDYVSLPSYCRAPLCAAFGTPNDRHKESDRTVERSRALIALAVRVAGAVTRKKRGRTYRLCPCQRRSHRARNRLVLNTRGHHENRFVVSRVSLLEK